MSQRNRDAIKEGMRLLIELPVPFAEGENKDETMSLGSRIEEVLGDDQLLIQMPMYKQYYYPLPRGESFKTFIFTDTRMFSQDMQFVNTTKIDGLEYAKVRRVGKMTSAQRRESYRLEIVLPITIERNIDGQVVACKTQLVNLSDGGLMFAADDKFEEKETVRASIDIGTTDEPQIETIEAEVIRLIPSHGVGIYRYRITAKFNHTCRRQKDRFYKFIIEKQREQLRQQMRD